MFWRRYSTARRTAPGSSVSSELIHATTSPRAMDHPRFTAGRPALDDSDRDDAPLMFERQLEDRRLPERKGRRDRVAAIFAVAIGETVAHRRRVEQREAGVAPQVRDVRTASTPRSDARRNGVLRLQTGRDRIVAAVGFLEQQHEIADARAGSEFAGTERPDQRVDVAAADVHVPRDDEQRIGGRRCL